MGTWAAPPPTPTDPTRNGQQRGLMGKHAHRRARTGGVRAGSQEEAAGPPDTAKGPSAAAVWPSRRRAAPACSAAGTSVHATAPVAETLRDHSSEKYAPSRSAPPSSHPSGGALPTARQHLALGCPDLAVVARTIPPTSAHGEAVFRHITVLINGL
eukprot:gene5608-biopygen2751